jgi:N-acyl-phosphatidylethanolamine-hydrolysing phospholipase D
MLLSKLPMLGSALLLAGCAMVNPYFDPLKKHHTPAGFVNNYPTAEVASIGEIILWQIDKLQKGGTPAPSEFIQGYPGFAPIKPDVLKLKQNCSDQGLADAGRCKKVSITWINHATALVQIGGLNILTDPMFSERASFTQWVGPKRKVKLPVALSDLPRIDLVVISHNHYDHLDRDTIKALEAQAGGPPVFAVPLGIDLWMTGLGISRVERFDWWDSKTLLGLDIHFLPSQHWSSRSLGDQNATLWGSWFLKERQSADPSDVDIKPARSLFFAGDTGYSADFLKIGKLLGPVDIALIPVGAYEPRKMMKDQHVNPEEAVKIHLDLGAKWALGIHWGTFELTDEPLDQPIGDLAKALEKMGVSKDSFVLFKHGESKFFD